MTIPRTKLPSGEAIPVLGMGTWRMGEDRGQRRREVRALRLGLDLGLTLIDTAEMYGDGGAEEVVGEAIAGRRDGVVVISKVMPDHATRKGVVAACERSLKRLKTDRIDLYLLHWRGSIPLRSTLSGFDDLLKAGKIRYAGVSNFDVSDMREVRRSPSGKKIAGNEVLYNLLRRGIEWDLLEWSRKHRMPIIAYSPLEEGLLSHREHPVLAAVARRHRALPAQIALAWIIRHPGVVAIPKASNTRHVREVARSANIRLSKDDLDELDESFAAPSGPVPLETR